MLTSWKSGLRRMSKNYSKIKVTKQTQYLAWEKVKLGEVVSFKTGRLDSNAATPDGEYPFFTCSQETLWTGTYSFDTECVLLAGNNANGVFPLKYFRGKFDAYQRTYVIRSLDERCLINRFLYYVLQLRLELLKTLSTGVATKFLTLTILKEIEFELPPVSIQSQIANVLSAYDDLIENNMRRIRILEEMARTIYREWFVHFRFPDHETVPRVPSPLGPIPQGWEVKKLGDILELNYGKGLKHDERSEGSVPVFGSSGVVGYHDTSLVKGPGIIVGRKGNVGSVFWSEADFYPIDTVYFVKSSLPLRFLFYDLQTKNFINNDAAVPGLSRHQAYSLKTVIPRTDVVSRFCGLADNFEQQASNLRCQIDNLRLTRDLLLPRLMSGELHVKNAETFMEKDL